MFDELAQLVNQNTDVLSFQIHSAQELEARKDKDSLSFRFPPENEALSAEEQKEEIQPDNSEENK